MNSLLEALAGSPLSAVVVVLTFAFVRITGVFGVELLGAFATFWGVVVAIITVANRYLASVLIRFEADY
ncbi:MAG TPA: hypothetical protein VKB35_15205 [Ktedonobacteraceae bacterium]|nr:hypothetical protein [Ktedonobacteraceae bacterium]